MPAGDLRCWRPCASAFSNVTTSTTSSRPSSARRPASAARSSSELSRSWKPEVRSPNPDMSKVVGIDLGTTNSLVAFVSDGAPFVIRDKSGDALLPSIVSDAADGTVYVGREAQRRLLTDPRRTVYSVKRFMGKGIDDVQGEAGLLPFKVSGEPGGVVRIGLGDREFTPPEISAFVLRELKRRAEEFFAAQGDIDPEVDRAVITVPA